MKLQNQTVSLHEDPALEALRINRVRLADSLERLSATYDNMSADYELACEAKGVEFDESSSVVVITTQRSRQTVHPETAKRRRKG